MDLGPRSELKNKKAVQTERERETHKAEPKTHMATAKNGFDGDTVLCCSVNMRSFVCHKLCQKSDIFYTQVDDMLKIS